MIGNRKYKDSVFTLLFKDKKKLIELFNAIEGTEYNDDVEIQINTLENVLFMDRKNDISFLVDGRFIVLVEHQSTINDNMPLRFLIYIARVYEKIIDNKAMYKETMIKIPTPEFVVLYNGDKESPKETTLRLSDAFIDRGIESELDLMVKVININYDTSAEVLDKSKTLKEYSYFIHKVKTRRKQGNSLEVAVEKSIKECINEGVLKKFLEEHGTEVVNMLFTEFNLEDAKMIWQEEAAEKATIITIKNEREKIAFQLLDVLDIETISMKTGLSIYEIEKLRKQ